MYKRQTELNYEEGTWTPLIDGASSTSGQSYNTQDGAYTKIGSMVHAQCMINLAAKGTISGFLRINGLPFNVSPGAQSAATFGYQIGFNMSAGNSLRGWVYANKMMYLLQGDAGSTDTSQISTSHIDSAVVLAMQVTYSTDE